MFSVKRVRFVILARKGISIIASALAATDKIYVYILRSKCVKTPEMFSIKRVPFVIRTHVESQQQTRYMRIFFVLNVEKHQKCFLKTCAARNTVSKGNIVAIVRWQQQTKYMCIFFVLNVEKHHKCFL